MLAQSNPPTAVVYELKRTERSCELHRAVPFETTTVFRIKLRRFDSIEETSPPSRLTRRTLQQLNEGLTCHFCQRDGDACTFAGIVLSSTKRCAPNGAPGVFVPLLCCSRQYGSETPIITVRNQLLWPKAPCEKQPAPRCEVPISPFLGMWDLPPGRREPVYENPVSQAQQAMSRGTCQF
jgi:hypothetical protein